MQMLMPCCSACPLILFRNATQFSAPSASGMPLRLPLKQMIFGTPFAFDSSIAACISGSSFSCRSLRFNASGMLPPGPGGYIVGVNPYFLSMGQSAGPFRSYPTMPIDAASLQPSSRLVPRAKTPPVTHCFKRPVFFCGAGPCAKAAEAAADADAKAGRKSLRRMKHEYHSAAFRARDHSAARLLDSYTVRLCLLFLLASAAAAQDSIVLKPDRVFDGEASHEGWAVRVRGGRIEAAGPVASIDSANAKV